VLAGEHDHLTPPESQRALTEAIVGARRLTLRGAGHLPQLEQPDEFDARLLEFLRQPPAPVH
jgi:pimeloyl-ACP methyl ester carboxylesterase